MTEQEKKINRFMVQRGVVLLLFLKTCPYFN